MFCAEHAVTTRRCMGLIDREMFRAEQFAHCVGVLIVEP